MIFSTYRIFLITIVGLFSTACLHQADDENTSNISGKPSNTVLEGSWEKVCVYDAEDDWYTASSIVITGNKFEFDSGISLDASCLMPTYSLRSIGTLKIGEKAILTSGETVTKFVRFNEKISLTVRDSEVVIEFNNEEICGKKNWVEDVESDVTNCADLEFSDEEYDIFKIDGADVYFGDKEIDDGLTINTRPTQLDSEFYTKL